MISQAVSEMKIFENNGHIHVYSPEITPVGYLFCKNIKHLSISSFVAIFFQLNDFVTGFPIQTLSRQNLTLP